MREKPDSKLNAVNRLNKSFVLKASGATKETAWSDLVGLVSIQTTQTRF